MIADWLKCISFFDHLWWIPSITDWNQPPELTDWTTAQQVNHVIDWLIPRFVYLYQLRILDREEQEVHYLTVVARDKLSQDILSSTVSVTVYVMDENDNGPVLEEPQNNSTVVRVSPKSAIGASVFKVGNVVVVVINVFWLLLLLLLFVLLIFVDEWMNGWTEFGWMNPGCMNFFFFIFVKIHKTILHILIIIWYKIIFFRLLIFELLMFVIIMFLLLIFVLLMFLIIMFVLLKFVITMFLLLIFVLFKALLNQ